MFVKLITYTNPYPVVKQFKVSGSRVWKSVVGVCV